MFFLDYWLYSFFYIILPAILLCVACINLLHPDYVCAKLAVQLCIHISSLLPCCASFPAVQICPISHGLTGWNSVWNGAATIQTLNNNKENFTDMPIFCPSPAGRERWGGDAKRAQSSIASPSKCSVHSQCHVLPQKHLIHPLHTHNFKYYIYINWNRIRSVFRLSLSGCYIHIFLYSQLQNYWHPW